MNKHEQARNEHKANAISAMAKENSPEARLRAFFKEQHKHFENQIGSLDVSTEVKSVLLNELSVYKSEMDEIVSTVMHGVKS